MAQFGKRRAGTSPAPARQPRNQQSDGEAALAFVTARNLPIWAKLDPVKLIVALLIFATLLGVMIFNYSGQVVRDLRLSGTWRAADDLRAIDGSCSKYLFLVTFCRTEIKVIAAPTQEPITSEFMMFFATGAGELLTPMRSTKDPSAVAVAYAADTKLRNRTVSLLFPTIVLSTLSIAIITLLAKGLYREGPAHRALTAGIVDPTVMARIDLMQKNPGADA